MHETRINHALSSESFSYYSALYRGLDNRIAGRESSAYRARGLQLLRPINHILNNPGSALFLKFETGKRDSVMLVICTIMYFSRGIESLLRNKILFGIVI